MFSWCRKSYILVLNIMIVSKVTNLSQLMKTMRDKCHSTPSQKNCSRSGNGSQILSSVTRTCWQATSHHWKKSIFLNHFFMLPFPVLVWDLQACPCPCPSCPSFLFQEHVSPKVWLQLCRHLPSHTTGEKNKKIQHHCHHPLYHQPFNPLTPRSD